GPKVRRAAAGNLGSRPQPHLQRKVRRSPARQAREHGRRIAYVVGHGVQASLSSFDGQHEPGHVLEHVSVTVEAWTARGGQGGCCATLPHHLALTPVVSLVEDLGRAPLELDGDTIL